MKAVRFERYGDAEVLEYGDAPTPEPGAGEVRIRVAGSAFNPVDAGIRGGYLQDAMPVSLPHVPGADVSGVVDAIGDGVSGITRGDAVVAFLPMTADGAAAEYAIAPADAVAPAPSSVNLTDAAALPSVATTAWQALFDAAGLRAGQRLLVIGAGGAVGGYAVQFGRHAGAHVIAVTDAGGLARVRELGADETIDRAAGAISVSPPVDVLLNLRGGSPDDLAALVPLVVDGGVVVNTVPAVPTPGDEARGVRAVPFFVRSDGRQLAEIVRLVDTGDVRVLVDERLPLADLASVHARSDAGTLRGKVVLVPPAD